MAEENPTPENDEANAPEAVEAEAAAPVEPVVPLTPKERKVASRVKRGQRRPSTPEARTELRKAKAAARSRRRVQEREKAKANRPAEPVPDVAARERVAGSAKIRLGTVTSAKADKTITVRIDTARRHRKYEKIVRSSSTLHAHDEANDANAGDLVRIVESRPLSRLKRWRLEEVLERAK
jgi:small subunit ribosomal protein S17